MHYPRFTNLDFAKTMLPFSSRSPTNAIESYPRVFLSYLLFSDCGLPVSPGNGSIALDSGVTTYASTATRKCNSGYVSIGLATIQCKVDGTWADRPFTCSLAGII